MFLDSEYKWKSKGRFSGDDISPGHYFALTAVGALTEMEVYQAKLNEYVLLRFDVEIDNILDLTNRDILVKFFGTHFSGNKDKHWSLVLDAFFSQQYGGDSFNDFAGHKAALEGYNGVAFFSARACKKYWPNPGNLEHEYYDRDLIVYNYESLSDDPDCTNILIYFGHNVVRHTSKISVCNFDFRKPDNPDSISDSQENKFFMSSYNDLDKLFSQDRTRPADWDLTYNGMLDRLELETYWPKRPGFEFPKKKDTSTDKQQK